MDLLKEDVVLAIYFNQYMYFNIKCVKKKLLILYLYLIDEINVTKFFFLCGFKLAFCHQRYASRSDCKYQYYVEMYTLLTKHTILCRIVDWYYKMSTGNQTSQIFCIHEQVEVNLKSRQIIQFPKTFVISKVSTLTPPPLPYYLTHAKDQSRYLGFTVIN